MTRTTEPLAQGRSGLDDPESVGQDVRRFGLAVIDLAGELGRQVLPEGAAQVDVQHLDPPADGEDRDSPGLRQAEEGQLLGVRPVELGSSGQPSAAAPDRSPGGGDWIRPRRTRRRRVARSPP